MIPLARFGPRTQEMLRQKFGDLDTSRTIGALNGARAPAAKTTAAAPPPGALPPRVQVAGPGAGNLPTPPIPPATPPPLPTAPSAPTDPETGAPVTGGAVVGAQTAPPAQTAGPGAPTPPPLTPPVAAPPAVFTPRQLTPTELAATSYTLPPEQEAGFRRAVAEVVGQPDSAPKIAAIEQARTTAIAAQREKADAARLAIEAKDRATFQANQDEQAKFDRDNAAKQAAALQTQQFEREKAAEAARQAVELEKQKSVFNIDQEGARQAFAADKNRLDKMGEGAAAMLPVGDQLRQLRPVLAGLPDAGIVSSVLGAYPQLTAAARIGGVISPQQADNVQLFQGLTNHLAGQLRISGSGSMSDKDLETFKSTLPQLVATKDGRIKAVAFLQNLSDRIVDEHDFAQQYFRRVDPATGKPAYNLDNLRAAINAPRVVDDKGINHGGLGPVMPQAPGHVGQTFDSMTAWIKNNVDVGHPYMGWGYPRNAQGVPQPIDPKTGKENAPELQLMVREK